MIRDTDIAWLAGLIDGEGCLCLLVRSDKYTSQISRTTGRKVTYGPYFVVRCDIKLAMTCQETIIHAAGLIAEIVGSPDLVRVYREQRKVQRARPMWRADLSSKQAMWDLLTAIRPYMLTKLLEADLCLDYLRRALKTRWHHASERDFACARLATALRHGCGEARAEALLLLSQVIPSEAASGSEHGSEGDAERVTTRGPSPNGNDPHERPAAVLDLRSRG